MKKTKEQGITLVALVITIIVLLILAGVALSALFGNSSIIDNANYAVTEYNKSVDTDQNVITSVEGLFAKYMGGEQPATGDDDDDDDAQPAPFQEQYDSMLTAQDRIVQDLFTYSTTEATTEGENGTAIVTGINWARFVDSNNPNDFKIVSSNLVYGGITEYIISVTTPAKKAEIASDLRRLIVPFEITINDKTYDVKSINMHESIEFVNTETEDFEYDFGEYIEQGYNYYIPCLASGSYYSYFGATETDTSYLIIPNSVESIDGIDFLPRDNILFAQNSGVREIPSNFLSYKSCTSYITLPRTLNSIGENAFREAHALTSIVIPEGITTISSGAFHDCVSLESVTLPSTLTTIGYEAFYRCHYFETLTIPNSVTTIEDGAFNYCSFGTLNLPATWTTIGTTFSCCDIQTLNIPEGVITIGDSAFSGCFSLTSVNIPEGVTTIGDHAFDNCYDLRSVTLPSTLQTIGEFIFNDCYLRSVTWNNNVYTDSYDLEEDLIEAGVNCDTNAFSGVYFY